MGILLNKTLRLFLDSVGRRDEYEFYLERFQSSSSGAFAILCPERSDLEATASVFAFDLEFLLRLGLTPVILLCGPYAEPMRDILIEGDHPFAPLPLKLDPAHPDEACRKVLTYLAECRQRAKAMVLVSESSLEEGLATLIPGVSSRIHFIRARGPLHTARGDPIVHYSLSSPTRPAVMNEDTDVVSLATRLLDHHPSLHISVASPINLLEELFTVKGAGCLIRMGSVIRRHTSLHDIDPDRLVQLFENSFKKKLVGRDCLDRANEFFVEENYRGAALLEPHEAGAYLSKFAVNTQARGEGVANEIWREIRAHHDALFWRASMANRINHWYERQADGYHQSQGWRVYWLGVDPDKLPGLIAYGLTRSEDFVDAPPTTP